MMNVRKSLLAIAAAVVGATAITAMSGSVPLYDRVIALETGKALPELAGELESYPPAVRLAFLDYAGDRELVLTARLALAKHPGMAEDVLGTYGPAPEFKELLRDFGPSVIPPIHYFMSNDLASVRLREAIAGWLPGADDDKAAVPQLVDAAAEPGVAEADGPTPVQRGWYAIGFIREEGYDFIGQFVVDGTGEVSWIQTERFATTAKRLFTSGVTTVEAKWHLGEDPTAADYGWAAVDVLAPIVAFKLARAGKLAARSAKSTATGARLARVGSAAARTARVGKTAAKVGIVAGVAYAAMNPGIISSIGTEIAGWIGLPGWLVQFGLWFLILLPLVLMLRFGYRWTIRPCCWLLGPVINGLTRLHRRMEAGTGDAERSAEDPTQRRLELQG